MSTPNQPLYTFQLGRTRLCYTLPGQQIFPSPEIATKEGDSYNVSDRPLPVVHLTSCRPLITKVCSLWCVCEQQADVSHCNFHWCQMKGHYSLYTPSVSSFFGIMSFSQLLIVQWPFQNVPSENVLSENVPSVSSNGVTRGWYTIANSPHPISTMTSVFYRYNGFSAQSENMGINLNTKHTHKRLSDSLFTRVRRSLHLKAWIATDM